jgi:CubicO group peptidase (beta-lactamase class C family)
MITTILSAIIAPSPTAEWLKTANQADFAASVRYYKQHFPAADHEAEAWQDLLNIRRGKSISFVRHSKTEPHTSLIKLNSVDEYFFVTIKGNEFARRRAQRQELYDVIPRATKDDLLPRIQAHTQKIIAAGAFRGVAQLTQNGKPIHTAIHGLANESTKQPITEQTRFNLASVGKLFTALAVARLVERGTLDLNQTVGHYLPEFKNQQIRDQVTLKHLLSHQSGLPPVPANPIPPKLSRESLQPQIHAIEQSKLIAQPGTQMNYANENFVLLGYILERVTGKSYWQVVEDEVLFPLGMRNTAQIEPQYLLGSATGYTFETLTPGYELGPLRPNEDCITLGGPAGGTYSTLADMNRLLKALVSNQLLSQSTFDQFTKQAGSLANIGGRGYGLGFEVITPPLGNRIGHSGGHPGINALAWIIPKTPYRIVGFSNTDLQATLLTNRWLWLIQDVTTNKPH